MGEVYGARDPRLNREVAIKVLPKSVTPTLRDCTASSRKHERLRGWTIPTFLPFTRRRRTRVRRTQPSHRLEPASKH